MSELTDIVRTSEVVPSDLARKIVLELFSVGALQRVVPSGEMSNQELNRFERQLSYFAEYETSSISRYDYQRRLRASHVLMLGLGGLGSWALQHFVACGVGRITGVDMDVVEESNLARQTLYNESDLGTSKAQAAKRSVTAQSSLTSFNGIKEELSSTQSILTIMDQLRDIKLVVLTADTPAWTIGRWAAEASMITNIPLLRGNRIGIGPFMLPGKTACPMCAWAELVAQIPDADQLVSQQQSFGGVPGAALSIELCLAATLLAEEAVFYLTGARTVRTLNAQLCRNSDGFGFFIQPFQRDASCPTCASASP